MLVSNQQVPLDNESLIENIKIAAVSYMRWLNSEEVGIKTDKQGTAQWRIRMNHFFHGADGYNRVNSLLKILNDPTRSPEAKITKTLRTLNSSGNRKHSFSRYLYQELLKPDLHIQDPGLPHECSKTTH